MYQKTVLDNRLRLVSMTMPQTRSVAIGILLGVGSRYESDKEAGISHFIEHLSFRGTEKRVTSRDISAAIEGLGGILNAGTDKELTIYWAKVAQHHFKLALDVLVDMLLHSRFDPEDIERERQVIIEEIHMSHDSPSQEVNLMIDELLWPQQPLGRDTAGTVESMCGINRTMLLDYLRGYYKPENTVVTIAGNISHDEAVASVREAVAGWTNGKAAAGFTASEDIKEHPRIKFQKRETEQAHLCLALPGLPLLHPDRFTLDLLNVILGEGMSSRLFTEIRDKMGLAYSIHSYIDHFRDAGALTIYAGVEPGKLRVAISAILEQLALLKESIPEEELNKAKELTKGRMLLRMEDTYNVAGWLGGQETLTGRILTIEQVMAIIDAITTEDLRRVAQSLLQGERLRLAVVGPAAQADRLEGLLKL